MEQKNINSLAISILVPVYKVEPYLQRCIDSVLSQDFTDWEMILVDDGSPDNCPRICDENATRHPEKIRVVHKKNGGLPSARLAGFKESYGEYIMFLDSDDFLLPKALSMLFNKINEGYDIVKGNNWRYFDNGTHSIEKPKKLNQPINSSKEYISAIINYDILPYLWGGIYKKNLFSEDVFIKVQRISICEDWITNQLIWKGVKKYTTIDKEVCAYYINPNSMMQSQVISYSYHEKLNQIMRENIKSEGDVLELVDREYIKSLIRGLFIPEIGWNDNKYKKIKEYISNDYNYNNLKEQIDQKFLLFIYYKPIFRIYSSIYKSLFFAIKQKFKKRKVIS